MAIKVDSRRQQWLSLLRLLLPLFMMGFTAAVSSMVEQNIVSTSKLAERASSMHPMSVLRLISHIKARKPFPGSLCKLPHLLCGPNHRHYHPIILQFLPHKLSLRLPLHPHSLPHLLHMLQIPSSSPLGLHMHHTLSLCNTTSLHNSTCSTSLPHMLHFVTSTLASSRHLHILKPSLPIPSRSYRHSLTLTRVSPGPAVTCHQLVFPFAVFLCQALHETTHTLEVEIKGKEGKALVQCKKDGICEWVREGSLVWVMKGEDNQTEANSAWLNQKFFGHLDHLMNVNIEHNNFNNSGNVSFTKSSSNTKQPSHGSQNGSGTDNANAGAGAEPASQEPNQTGTPSTSSDAASPSDGSTNSNSNAANSKASGDSLSSTPSAGSGSTAINGDSSSTSTPAGSDTNSGTDDGTGGSTGATGSSKTKRPTLLHH